MHHTQEVGDAIDTRSNYICGYEKQTGKLISLIRKKNFWRYWSPRIAFISL